MATKSPVRPWIPLVLIAVALVYWFVVRQWLVPALPRSNATPVAINFAHLQHLTQSVTVNGHDCDIIHIYANAPTYEWTGDDDEGIACVDDVARAARVYLNEFEATGRPEHAERATRLLSFVLAMQTDDGLFANFIWPDHTVNDTGKTSQPVMDFWTARALHALGQGQRVLIDTNPELAAKYGAAFERALNHSSFDVGLPDNPLLNRAGSDMLAIMVLALLEHRAVSPTARGDRLISALCDHIAAHSFVGSEAFPFRVQLSWRDHWHRWGMQQSEALALAGRALDRQDWIDAAVEEGDGFLHELVEQQGPIAFKIEHSDTSDVRWYPQIAYGIAAQTACFNALYRVTGDDRFADLSEQSAAWPHGANPAQTKMYNPVTGRCYDGINDALTVNQNSGAESTIEALLALQAVAGLPRIEQHHLILRAHETPTQAVRDN